MNVIPSSYYDIINPVYITRDFYESYTDKAPPWGTLGALVFIRTYSHYIPDLDISLAKAKNFRRREKWQEVCLRVVEYNMSLEPDNVRTHEEKKEEAEKLYDLFFNLKAFPSGRTLWVGGTQKIKEDGSANFNCSFVTIDNLTKFSETFYMLLVGAGVGFSVESRYTKDLPLFNKDTVTNHVLDSRNKAVAFRKEHTTVIVRATDAEGNLIKKRAVLDNFNPADGYNPLSLVSNSNYKKLEIDIEVGDSKKGWSSALYVYLFSLTIYGDVVVSVNYNQVRPAGERLRTFGGTASGPEPLRKMFRKFHWKIKNSKGEVDTSKSLFSMVRLTNTDVMDIENMIAEGVVCGGVRRSSLICLFSEDDVETRTCKVDLWDWKHDSEINDLLGKLELAGYTTDQSNTDVLWATERLLPVVIEKKLTKLTAIGEFAKSCLFWLSAALKTNLDFSRYAPLFSTEVLVKEVIHPAEIVDRIDELAPKYRYRRSRVMSNNSVAVRESLALDQIKECFEAIKSNGEPGFINFINAEAKRPNFKGVNPCFTGDTLVYTRQGYYRIKDLVGKTVDVWDGERYVTVDNFRVTAEDQEVYDVELESGQVITATAYHKFILDDGSKVELKDLKEGDRLFYNPVNTEGTIEVSSAYLKGFLLGDGTQIDGRPLLHLYEPKYSCKERLIESCLETPASNLYNNLSVEEPGFADPVGNNSNMQGLSARKSEFIDWVTTYRTEGLPDEIYNWTDKCKADFIAGYMDADGTASDTRNGYMYQVSSINQKLLKDFQFLLSTLGVTSRFSLMKKAGFVRFRPEEKEYLAKASYRISISQVPSIKLSKQVNFTRLVSFSDKVIKHPPKKNCWNKIKSIKFSHIASEVYCCTVNTTNSFQLGLGIRVGQCSEILLDDRGTCNLTTRNFLAFVNPDGTFDKKGYLEASALLTRWSYRITMVKMFSEKWDKIQQRDRLLGLSMTGLTDGLVKLGWSDTGEEITALYKEDRELIEEEGIRFSKMFGLEQPLLSTTIKPEGTLSLLPGVSCGIHKGYAPYYIRRIRVSTVDPVCKVLKDLGVPNCPENGQKEETADTTVFTFYVKTEADSRAIDEPVQGQLERYKVAMANYVDHNCSVTVTLDAEKGEYEEAAQWLYDNPNSYIGVSFLPKFDPSVESYPNMPYEPISEEVYYRDKHDVVITEDKLIELLTKYENDTYSDIHDVAPDCATGNCPVR